MAPLEAPHAAPETGRPCFADLPGWTQDDLAAALDAYRQNPPGPLSEIARAASDAKALFEALFRPGSTIPGRFTGYYEPELSGARAPSDAFSVPIHAMPSGPVTAPRAEIEPLLAGHEIAWLRDEVDRFFLQVQGSGRIQFEDGETLRVGFAGRNGHPYRSIGKLLVERGVFDADIDAEALKAWLRADPERGRAVMAENPSYVMFDALDLPPGAGPMGTLCPLSGGRSLAVDPEQLPLGTPVWVETQGIARLCVAQDTGAAIRGPGRADLFFGTGDAAGRAAGRLNHPGRFTPLLPR
ncbi:MltA domain-containing protein [uncultured Jannaschia sp.]|uniref:murein transglycosylase A n=1 Tax=uncultured Jannaschia sp. TaxID=293347 RepID=UPI002603B890|nr:MltA domain-containing protein [uncultured Jannaschia sp.]